MPEQSPTHARKTRMLFQGTKVKDAIIVHHHDTRTLWTVGSTSSNHDALQLSHGDLHAFVKISATGVACLVLFQDEHDHTIGLPSGRRKVVNLAEVSRPEINALLSALNHGRFEHQPHSSAEEEASA